MNNIKIGIDVGENQAEPRTFVDCAILADKLGFHSLWLGDHFMPLQHKGGKSQFVWSVMATALELTNKIKIGPDVTCPIGGRYHPALIAQASATLDNLYPGRFLLGVGSGEAVNELPFMNGKWPKWQERIERLSEAVTLIRQLWNSTEYFDFHGKFFSMKQVYLYTKPSDNIPIHFSAFGPKAANYAGKFGDCLTTHQVTPSRCVSTIYPQFEDGAKQVGKNYSEMEKMVLLPILVGDRAEIVKKLKKGGASTLGEGNLSEPDPRNLEKMAATVSTESIEENFVIISSVDKLIDVVCDYIEVGTDQVVFGTDAQPQLIKEIGEKVLPHFNNE